ncbi:GNAT family N-acetyltransferase [Clostridium sp.]|uniref:GNAT family N-acetyltransferase n=1 Tax=Clostridium sp. TaxID=1506 RepID=UPI003D6D6814
MIKFRELKLEEMEAWFDHCMYVFNGGTYSQSYRQYFTNHYYNDPWRDLESILVAVEDKKIVSTVRIFHRRIYLNGQIIEMGGIGEVSTILEYRCKGLSSKLLALAIRKMKEKGINVSMLGADLEKIGFYSKFGWESLSRCFNKSTVKGKNDLNIKMRQVNFDTDIPQIAFVFNEYSRKRNGIVVRDEECYWSKWVKNEVKNFYVVEDEMDKIIAYIDFEKCDKIIQIREFGELSGKESIFPLLVPKIINHTCENECEVIYSIAIQSPFIVDKLIEETNEMIKLINPFNFGDIKVQNTKEFVKILSNCAQREVSKAFVSWHIDGF